MSTIIRSFCATLAALCATVAIAAEPVAVWSGFNNLKSGTYSADIGALVPNAATGAVTLGSNGIRFANSGDAWAGSTKGWTVAIKYSTFTSGTAAALVSLQQNSETTAAGIDKIGAWVDANGKVQGLWQAGAYGTANGTLPEKGVVFVRYNDGNGTSVHLQNGTLLYAEGGLKSSSNNWGKSFAVGSFANGISNVASGMTIEGVAIFDSRVSDADMAAYEFPEPSGEYETLTHDGFLTTTFVDTGWDFDLSKLDECEITGEMSGSSIANRPAASAGYWVEGPDAKGVMKFQMQVYQYNSGSDHWLKAVEVELKKGDNGNVWIRAVRSGYTDGGMTDPQGSIKITDWNSTLATSETAGGYGVCKVVVKVPTEHGEAEIPSIISINIANADTSAVTAEIETLAGTIPAAGWITVGYPANNGERKGSTSIVKYTKGEECGTVSGASFTWTSAGTSFQNMINGISSSIPFMKDAYCRASGAILEGATLTLAGIPYKTYDAVVYISGKASTANKSITVNGTAYYGGPIDDAHQYGTYEGSSASWGQPTNPAKALAYGVNAIRVEGQTDSDLVIELPNPFGGNWGVAAIQVVENVRTPIVEKTSKAEVTTDSTWDGLSWDVMPAASDRVELTVSANAKLTIDDDTQFKSLKLLGQSNLTIAGITAANIALISKISTGSFTGKPTFEIDASAGLTADDALKNFIKTANAQFTFIFKSTAANKGATINFGTAVNVTLNSHIEFDGGTHAFTYGQGEQSRDFGANASNGNPTVWVKNGTTLNFTAKDLSGWNGTANAAGVIRVDNGAKLNFLADGRNTIYYRQRLCLEPGAQVTFSDATGQYDSKPVMRFLGGTAENNEVIYVLPSTGNEPAATVTGDIFLPSDNTHGFGVFVDANSRLKWTGNVLAVDENDDKAIVKRGPGVLEYHGTMDGFMKVMSGSIAGDGSFRKLTVGDNGALDFDSGAPTVRGALAMPNPVNLIGEPSNGLAVVVPPAGFDVTGRKAVVNGKTCDLYLEGGALRIQWARPPVVEPIDPEQDFKISPSGDYGSSTVMVNVSYRDRGDYDESAMSYQIVIGDKTYVGTADAAEGNAKTVTFEIDELAPGTIYRGAFRVLFDDAKYEAASMPIAIRQGKLVHDWLDSWVNETPDTLGTTGAYEPMEGVEVKDGAIVINSNEDVTFYPTLDPDYVDKCDSKFTISISAEEAIDDDDSEADEGAQAGVMIVADGNGGVIFKFINGEEWVNGPAAELNREYEVTVSFHYAKDGVDGDEDSVTYEIAGLGGVYSYAHRANTADKVNEVVFSDGTRFSFLVGTCQIERADPVPQGLAPGDEPKIIVAENDEDAQTQADAIPILIPDNEEIKAALDTEDKKNRYKGLLKVVAVKEGSQYKAKVVLMPKDPEIQQELQKQKKDILVAVAEKLGALLESDGDVTLTGITGEPGLFYGVAADGELISIGKANQEELMEKVDADNWKIAGSDGTITGLKVKKIANADKGFYKVICTPAKPQPVN